MADALTTDILGGRYHLLQTVARGGSASVHLAHDDLLDRVVAVKRLHRHLADDPVFVDRFRREAVAVASVSDPNVVAIHDVSPAGTWLVMEHVDGTTLRQVIAVRGRLEPAQALAVLGPVASGLAAAHDAGIVHRDVKPENVLVGLDGVIKIGDFGLARAAASTTHTFGPEAFAGSPHYVSPEAVRGEMLDARSDVYALGVMLYELLIGRPPLDADTPLGVAMAHLEQRVPAPSASLPTISAAVDAVVLAATSPNRADRPLDARAFAQALSDAVPGGPAMVDLRMGETSTIVLPVDLGETVVVRRPDDRVRHPVRRRLLVVLLVLAVAAGGWALFDRVVAPVGPVPVTIGQTTDDAVAALEAAGFSAIVADEPQNSTTVPVGAVVAVAPSTARPGATVTVVPSAGPRQIEVPRLAGFREEAAVTAIGENGLDHQIVREFDDVVPAGDVIASRPAATTVIDETVVVDLVISLGREPIDVPPLVGTSLTEATELLDDLGLQLGVVRRADDPDVPVDHVISQGEAAGAMRFRGDRVGLVVSDGPAPFELPDVRGGTESAAVAELETLGLVVEVVSVETTSADRVGLVDEQAPSGGREVRQGARVTLFVWVAAS